MKYCVATNTGKGFITAEDRTKGHMSGHGANVYAVSDNHDYWIARVGGTIKTKEEAEEMILIVSQQNWDNNNRPDETPEQKIKRIGPRPISITLPA